MKTPFDAGVAVAFCVFVAGCATPGASSLTTVSADTVKNAITIGKSTKTDVIAALGKTRGIRFDSGFEVWVYRVTGDTSARLDLGGLFRSAGSEKGSPGATEFVILFAPSGVVAKTRIRPPPLPEAS